MKKFGFTLAEVLITLGIVGVIAAITIPGLTRNVSQKSIGPALAKAVNNLSAANLEALKQSGVTTLSAVDTDYTKVLRKYMDGMRVDGKTATATTTATDPKFYGNDGISYEAPAEMSEATISDTVMKGSGKYKGKYWKVTIDINGDSGTAKPGYDQFLVYVDDYGIIIPAGGQTAKKYGAEADVTNCITSAKSIYCTATVAENGWNVTY